MKRLTANPGQYNTHDARQVQSSIIKYLVFLPTDTDPSQFDEMTDIDWKLKYDTSEIVVAKEVQGMWADSPTPITGPTDGHIQATNETFQYDISVIDEMGFYNQEFWESLEFQSKMSMWSVLIITKCNQAIYVPRFEGLAPVNISVVNIKKGKRLAKAVSLSWVSKSIRRNEEFPDLSNYVTIAPPENLTVDNIQINSSNLSWEGENMTYVIERSEDGVAFETIGQTNNTDYIDTTI